MAKSEYIWVRNTKPASVGMHSGKTLVRFEPGVHKYSRKLLAGINMTRAANKAYWEGEDPVLSEVDSPTNPKAEVPEDVKAADMIALIKTMADLDALEKITKEDARKTVVAAAEKRIAELLDPPQVPDAGTGSGDGNPED